MGLRGPRAWAPPLPGWGEGREPLPSIPFPKAQPSGAAEHSALAHCVFSGPSWALGLGSEPPPSREADPRPSPSFALPAPRHWPH